jgi:hypothetical protein
MATGCCKFFANCLFLCDAEEISEESDVFVVPEPVGKTVLDFGN